MTKYVIVELNPLELHAIHKGLELLRKQKYMNSILTKDQIMMISEDFRNASNQKLMESTILSGRIRWGVRDIPKLKEMLGVEP